MSPEVQKYLWDALQAAERAQRFAAGLDFAAYLADELRRAAIERQLGIVGEALAQARRLQPELAEALPELHRAVALRHVLIHAYAAVDDAVVWGVVEQHLQGLLAGLRRSLP
jgi:uncharacterized protein with HEPN domain